MFTFTKSTWQTLSSARYPQAGGIDCMCHILCTKKNKDLSFKDTELIEEKRLVKEYIYT